MRTPGTYISAIGHVGLIGWLILGWGFNAEPLPQTVTAVSVISGEEFDQLTAASTPEPGLAEPDAPVVPQIEDVPPAPPVADDNVAQSSPPDPVEQPVVDTQPPPPPPLSPPAEVADVPPVAPTPPAAPAPVPDLPVASRPVPRPAETIASTIAPPPPPDSVVDDVVREPVEQTQEPTPEPPIEEVEPTAPEESTDRITPEEEEPATAPVETPVTAVATSIRPSSRPSRPVPPVETADPVVTASETADPVADPVVPDTSEADAIAAAVAAANQAPSAPAVSAGPPMSGAEKDSFRIAVNRCWNVDAGSQAARVTVDVGFNLDRNGQVQGNIRLVGSDGDQSATQVAFEAARRAVLRCQSGGYQLPADKYEQWKDVVITFDPSGMRLR